MDILSKVEFIVFGVQTSNDVRNNLKQFSSIRFRICTI